MESLTINISGKIDKISDKFSTTQTQQRILIFDIVSLRTELSKGAKKKVSTLTETIGNKALEGSGTQTQQKDCITYFILSL